MLIIKGDTIRFQLNSQQNENYKTELIDVAAGITAVTN